MKIVNPADENGVRAAVAMLEKLAANTLDEFLATRASLAAMVVAAPFTPQGVAVVGKAAAMALRQILASCPPEMAEGFRESAEAFEANHQRMCT